ncbi:glutaminase family protein [Terracidiphilus gabretensis]|uniref:glutaminase family protein n=1 Tax=Terracidiphilus gabretensis TaxID=1577687 RepID=UPI00071B87D7|nr:glutaminase family protein [Terracidiphilus gabretensis]
MKTTVRFLTFVAIFCLGVCAASSQQRPPATPLIVHDPYFSIWSKTDQLTGSDTSHWTGAPQPIAGIARIDGKAFRFMGRQPESVPAMEQTARSVSPTHTRYQFRQNGITLELTFFTPAMMNDLDVLSRPVTYLTWSVQATDQLSHRVSILLDVDPIIAVNDRAQNVVLLRSQTSQLNVLSVGSRDQNILNRSGDNLRIDWGYFHLAIPKSENSTTAIASDSLQSFAETGNLPTSDSMSMPRPADRATSHLAASLDFGTIGSQPVVRHLLVSYTEDYAIQYLQRNLRPYWQRDNMPVEQMLDMAAEQYSALEQRATAFDTELTADLTKIGGEHYAAIAVLSYRQTLAAHKLVADVNGDPMLFAKENFSNGCIATVDVLYPSAPFFLFLQPKLLEAQLIPVLEYSALARWRFPFAPHDLGQYPLANGQVYGGGEKTEDDQMPVEESGNMLILIDALARAEGNANLAQRFWPQLSSWAQYLKEKGLDPENQLTTDDFAGHVAHNANLSIKAIEALAAYGDLAHLLGHEDIAKDYSRTARAMAEKWVPMAREGDHYKLAFNSPGTWSQKYNLVWDQILSYNLFPKSVREAELSFYLGKINTYGLPLDNRADYTKLDWSVWTATLASNSEQFNAIIDPIYRWTNETPNHVPLTDWYDTKTGKQVGFQARSVVGGVFIKALSDKQLTTKWNSLNLIPGIK